MRSVGDTDFEGRGYGVRGEGGSHPWPHTSTCQYERGFEYTMTWDRTTRRMNRSGNCYGQCGKKPLYHPVTHRSGHPIRMVMLTVTPAPTLFWFFSRVSTIFPPIFLFFPSPADAVFPPKSPTSGVKMGSHPTRRPKHRKAVLILPK